MFAEGKDTELIILYGRLILWAQTLLGSLELKFHFHYPNRTSVGLGQGFNDGMTFPATKANYALSSQTSVYCILSEALS